MTPPTCLVGGVHLPGVRVVAVRMGDRAYEALLGPLRRDRALMARIWADAESRLDEEPGKIWHVATIRHGGRRIAGAWAAAVEIEHEGRRTLRCCDSYERPDLRGRGLYVAAYAHRHRLTVARSALPAVTWIFGQPLGLHLRDGWRVVDRGVSDEPDAPPHEWFELRRPEPGHVAF